MERCEPHSLSYNGWEPLWRGKKSNLEQELEEEPVELNLN
jgi:hypothetical protein